AFGAVAVHPDAARVEHAPHAAVERGAPQRLERRVIDVGGAVRAVERRVHRRVAVLQRAEPVVRLREIADHGQDAGGGEGARGGLVSRAPEDLVALGGEARRDGAADVTGGPGDEDALVHGARSLAAVTASLAPGFRRAGTRLERDVPGAPGAWMRRTARRAAHSRAGRQERDN